jgi:methionine synthase II (cobalamin-independent)
MENNERLELMKHSINTINKLYKNLVDDTNFHLRKNIEHIEEFGLTYEIVKNNAYSLDVEQSDYLETNIKDVELANNLFVELNETSKTLTHKVNEDYISFIDVVDELKSKLKNISGFSTDLKFYEFLEDIELQINEIKELLTLHINTLQNNFLEYKQFSIYCEHKEMIDIKFNVSKMTAFALSTDTDDEFKNSIKL